MIQKSHLKIRMTSKLFSTLKMLMQLFLCETQIQN